MIGGFRPPPTGDRYKLETTNPDLYPPTAGLQSLPANLCLVVAPDFSYGYGLYRPELRLDWERVVAAWQSSRQLRAYYDLPTVYFPDIGGPQPLGLEILSFIYPRLAAAGYRGIYIYGAAGWGHGAVTNYILAKLNWDAGADVQKLANEFFRWAYGPDAGEKVSRLYALVDDAAKAYYAAGGGAGEVPDPAALHLCTDPSRHGFAAAARPRNRARAAFVEPAAAFEFQLPVVTEEVGRADGAIGAGDRLGFIVEVGEGEIAPLREVALWKTSPRDSS